MKSILILLLSVLAVLQPSNDGKSPQEEYIERFSGIAVSEMKRTGVPASITLAQGLIESGAGRSSLATDAHNHFGIKCHRDWKGRKVFHDDDAKGECFRAYDNDEQSFRDHSDFLRYYDRYKSLFSIRQGDYKSWAYGLKAAGYATAPNYATVLISYIEKYNLNRFDSAVEASAMPENPLKIEEAVKVTATKPAKSSGKKCETVSVSFSRLYRKNGVDCVFALDGESYRSLASHYGLSIYKILQFNELNEEVELLPGTLVYISPKKKQAAEGLEKYIFGDEPESLRDISQRFGVKLSSIIKMNNLPDGYEPAPGETIRLRK